MNYRHLSAQPGCSDPFVQVDYKLSWPQVLLRLKTCCQIQIQSSCRDPTWIHKPASGRVFVCGSHGANWNSCLGSFCLLLAPLSVFWGSDVRSMSFMGTSWCVQVQLVNSEIDIEMAIKVVDTFSFFHNSIFNNRLISYFSEKIWLNT